jgi:hypothetical protein
MIDKQKSVKSKKLRDSANGEDCHVRLLSICNWRPETTVLAHLNGGGMALKKSDIHAAFACSACHDEIDRRTQILDADYVELEHRRGIERTQEFWLQKGLIKVV